MHQLPKPVRLQQVSCRIQPRTPLLGAFSNPLVALVCLLLSCTALAFLLVQIAWIYALSLFGSPAGLRPPYNRAAASGCLVPAHGRDPSACGKDKWPGSSESPRLSKVPGYPACPLQDPFLLNPFLSGRKFHNPKSPFSFDVTKTAKEIQSLSLTKINSETSYLQTRTALGGLRGPPEKLQQHSRTNTQSNWEEGRKSSSILRHRLSPKRKLPSKSSLPRKGGSASFPSLAGRPMKHPGQFCSTQRPAKPRCLDSQEHGGGTGALR